MSGFRVGVWVLEQAGDALELISIHSRMQDGPPVVVLDLVRLGARAGVRARPRV